MPVAGHGGHSPAMQSSALIRLAPTQSSTSSALGCKGPLVGVPQTSSTPIGLADFSRRSAGCDFQHAVRCCASPILYTCSSPLTAALFFQWTGQDAYQRPCGTTGCSRCTHRSACTCKAMPGQHVRDLRPRSDWCSRVVQGFDRLDVHEPGPLMCSNTGQQPLEAWPACHPGHVGAGTASAGPGSCFQTHLTPCAPAHRSYFQQHRDLLPNMLHGRVPGICARFSAVNQGSCIVCEHGSSPWQSNQSRKAHSLQAAGLQLHHAVKLFLW